MIRPDRVRLEQRRQPNGVDMQEDESLPTVTFEALDEHAANALDARRLNALDGAPRLRDAVALALAPVLRSGPEVAAAMGRRGRYLVEFTPGGAEQLKRGAVHFLERRNGALQPTLVAPGGKIAENATLAKGIAQKASSVAALANVAVLLVVQAQLVSMERALERIEGKLDGIRKLLDDQKVAEVRGRLRALAKLRDEMATARWTPEDRLRWQVALDQADTEFHQVEELARLQCDEHKRRIEEATLTVTMFGPSGDALLKAFQDDVDRFRRHLDLLLLCMVGRIVVAQFRRRINEEAVLHGLEDDLALVRKEIAAHELLVKSRALDFTTKFRRASWEIGSRRRLVDEAEEHRAQADDRLGRLRDHLQVLRSSNAPKVRALVEIGDAGRVANVDLLSDP